MSDDIIVGCIALAKKIRLDVLHLTALKKAGFIGSSFSCADILAVLYGGGFVSGKDGESENIFLLSKGHAASALYAALANTNVFSRKRLFAEFNTVESNMGVHPKRGSLSGIMSSGGSLGQVAGQAAGVALADKIMKRERKVYVLLGDGECNEGSVWETFMFAARHELENLTFIIDRNCLQSYGYDKQVLNMGDMVCKLKSFGLDAVSVDGHDCGALYAAFLKSGNGVRVIVADTVKGKGVKEFEDNVLWHYKWPEERNLESARKELDV